MVKISKNRKTFSVKIGVILIILIIVNMCCGCGKTNRREKETTVGSENRYIVLMMTNKHHKEVRSYLGEMKYLYGENDPDRNRFYAFGLIGPMLLTQSVEEMQEVMHAGFKMAEEFDIPVYFQLDDVNNYTTYFGSGAEIKYYEDPEMCEWVCFPEEGESYGGENQYGALPRFWFNWGSWMCAKAFPNLASEKLQEFVVSQLEEGVLKPLTEWLQKLEEEEKEYLFAGMSMGWETHIPDYSRDNPLVKVDKNNLPISYGTSIQMEEWEATAYGYGALHALGYDQQKLEEEAERLGITYDERRKEILYQVIHDYTELLCKTAWEAGIPREKIVTHTVSNASYTGVENPFTPPIWCAVNDYSIPGFTMSPVTCKYDLETMKEEILKADPDQIYFANAEGYAAGLHDEKTANTYFEELFGQGALVVTAFGFPDRPTAHFTFERTPEFGYNIAVNKWLDGD